MQLALTQRPETSRQHTGTIFRMMSSRTCDLFRAKLGHDMAALCTGRPGESDDIQFEGMWSHFRMSPPHCARSSEDALKFRTLPALVQAAALAAVELSQCEGYVWCSRRAQGCTLSPDGDVGGANVAGGGEAHAVLGHRYQHRVPNRRQVPASATMRRAQACALTFSALQIQLCTRRPHGSCSPARARSKTSDRKELNPLCTDACRR